jgi:GT2 family glycosyltransferase
MNAPASPPLASIVVLNYNGARWIERCIESLRKQTILSRLEILIADNLSGDGSDRLAEAAVRDCPNARFIQNGENLGYCEGNNRAARLATGEYLFFLNNDAWLEPDCMERFLAQVKAAGAAAACPLVLNYDDSSFQSIGAWGMDIFGLPTTRVPSSTVRDVLMPEGCAYLIKRTVFEWTGGFDAALYMYSDELDLSFRVWLSGHRAIAAPDGRVHHRGAVHVNPEGGGQVVEFRTSDTKRFYANRNALLVLLKNGDSLLFILALLQIGMLAVEALAALILVRRWAFVRRAYVDAVLDCWRMRDHIATERRRIALIRMHGDFWMMRFLRGRPNRWDELVRMSRMGAPKVTAR